MWMNPPTPLAIQTLMTSKKTTRTLTPRTVYPLQDECSLMSLPVPICHPRLCYGTPTGPVDERDHLQDGEVILPDLEPHQHKLLLKHHDVVTLNLRKWYYSPEFPCLPGQAHHHAEE